MPKTVAGSVSDPTLSFTKITVDDQEYSLLFRFNEVALAEKATGLSLLSGLGSFLSGNATFSDYHGLFYAVTRLAHPGLTVEQVGELCLDVSNLTDIRNGILRAYRESLPEKKRAMIDVKDDQESL